MFPVFCREYGGCLPVFVSALRISCFCVVFFPSHCPVFSCLYMQKKDPRISAEAFRLILYFFVLKISAISRYSCMMPLCPRTVSSTESSFFSFHDIGLADEIHISTNHIITSSQRM